MKRLISTAVAALMSLTPMAQAESYELSKHEDWKVSLNISDGSLFCNMSTFDIKGQNLLLLMVSSNDSYALNISTSEYSPAAEVMMLRLMFTGNGAENVYRVPNFFAVPTGNVWNFMTDLGSGKSEGTRKIVRALMKQKWMVSTDSEGNPQIMFNLKGSANAVMALEECRQRISK